MSTAIHISNLSKIYHLGEIGTGTISRDLERWYKMKIRGKADPFLKIGETNDRNVKGVSNVVYSLRDINFSVQQGETHGIIGKNGAGKSTLLKLLSRVTSPTTGKINIKGRVASLLEIGTGFHPELTGLENIFLNGAILGMRKHEITRKLDEIIDFSGVERYIDTPVKRYSSGMYVRLAFAVAAHLESEIMIVDEVLAVGDAEFQQKCLGKMGEVSKGEGRTILFVSHNMAAVQKLCNYGLLLDNGTIRKTGNMSEVISDYLTVENCTEYEVIFSEKTKRSGNGNIQFESIKIYDDSRKLRDQFSIGENIIIDLAVKNKGIESRSEISLQIKSADGMPVFHIMCKDSNFKIFHSEPLEIYSVLIEDIRLFPGQYSITIACGNLTGHEIFDQIDDAIIFNITDGGKYTHRDLPRAAGLFFLTPKWSKT